MTRPTPARRLFDATSVPDGPHGEFPRQLCEQIDSLVKSVNDVRKRLTASGSSAPVGYFPRVKSNNTIDDPYMIAWGEIGTAFDDTGWDGPATEQTVFYLPESSTYTGNSLTESPYFLFHRTQAYDLYVVAQGDDVIAVDLTDQSSAGSSDGCVALTTGNSSIALRMMDTGWRAYAVTGTWEIDKALPP